MVNANSAFETKETLTLAKPSLISSSITAISLTEFIVTSIIFPKANCHVHANGMATNEDVCRLAYYYGVKLSAFSKIREDGYRLWADENFAVSHEAYDQTVSLIRQPSDLKDIVTAGLIRDSQAGSIYTRLLASGMNNCRNDSEVIEVFERNTLATIAAIKDARAATGMEAFLFIAGKRHLENGPMRAHRLLDAVEAFQKKRPDEARFITGFDLSGNEPHTNCGEFYDVFERAYTKLRLATSCHTGEMLGPEDTWAALELPGIMELAHILSAIQDPRLLEAIRDRGILVDQLIISNDMLHKDRFPAPDDFPRRAYYDAGMLIGLGSDDPGLQQTNIGDEYDRAARHSFTETQLLEFTANSIRLGAIPQNVKRECLSIVAKFARESGIPLCPVFLRAPATGFERGFDLSL